MLIKNIKLHNFRQFKGDISLEIDNDFSNNRNITVIHGDNTFGKTTFLQSLVWCLYGETSFNDQFLLNEIVKNNMTSEESVFVEIEVYHLGNRYIIKREQEFKFDSQGDCRQFTPKVFVNITSSQTGATTPFSDTDAQFKINEILPKELKDYFFYDTEHLQAPSNKNLKESIEKLLGLAFVENALEHLGNSGSTGDNTLIGRINKSVDSSANEELAIAKQNLENIHDELVVIRQKESDCHHNIDDLDKEIGKIESELRGYQDSSELQKKIDSLRQSKQMLESELSELKKKYLDEFKKPHNYTPLLSKRLFTDARNFIDQNGLDLDIFADITGNTIDDIIRKSECLCGTEICTGSEQYNHLQILRKSVPPETLGSSLKNFGNDIANYINNNDTLRSLLIDYSNQINDRQKDISRVERDISGVDTEMLNTDSVRNKFENKQRLAQERDGQNHLLGAIGVEIKQKYAAQKSVEAEIQNLIKTDSKNMKSKVLLNYAIAAQNKICESFELLKSNLRTNLNNSVNTIFQNIFSGNSEIQISDNYDVKAIVKNGTHLDESAGQTTVKNFSFVYGLIQLAREETQRENVDAKYACVFDAPFSSLDEWHIQKLCETFHSFSDQVIIFIKDNDWEQGKEQLEPYLASEYRIVRDDPRETRLARIEKER